MANYGINFAGKGSANMPDFVTGSGAPFSLAMDFEVNQLSVNAPLMGESSPGNFIYIFADGAIDATANGTKYLETDGFVALNTRYRLTLDRVSGNDLTAVLSTVQDDGNGNETGTTVLKTQVTNLGGVFRLDLIGKYSSTLSTNTIYSLSMTTGGVAREYINTTGTGTTWVDIISGQDAPFDGTLSAADWVVDPLSGSGPVLTSVAGSDQTVTEGDTVTLDGTGSANATTYAWTQTAGTDAGTITNANTATATFTAPDISADETLTFRLTTGNGSTTVTDDIDIIVEFIPPQGTLTLDLVNNTGQVIASRTGVIVAVYNNTTGALIKRFDGLSTNSSGQVAFSDALIVASTVYKVVLEQGATELGVSRETAS